MPMRIWQEIQAVLWQDHPALDLPAGLISNPFCCYCVGLGTKGMRMHPLLQPILPTGITVVLWCVCSAAAVILQPSKLDEPQPPPGRSPLTPFTVVVRTIPITMRLPLRGTLAGSSSEPCRPPSARPTGIRTSRFSSNLPSKRRSARRAAISLRQQGSPLLSHWSNFVMEVQAMSKGRAAIRVPRRSLTKPFLIQELIEPLTRERT